MVVERADVMPNVRINRPARLFAQVRLTAGLGLGRNCIKLLQRNRPLKNMPQKILLLILHWYYFVIDTRLQRWGLVGGRHRLN